ncbi:MAG: FkbM family methyltransferase [Fibromonadaceae bacterium]|jgi:FkbM family methyltransferase|nr:FkbM family methyltransferase [Fibromonadaceae bacterium]
MTQAKEIYGHLEDEASRKIFECRLLYYLTGDHRFIGDMILFACPEIKSFFDRHKNIVLYGAGYWGTMASLYFPEKVVAFCDSNKAKHNTYINRCRIVSHEELVEKHSCEDIGIIVYVVDDNSKSEIKSKLLESRFSENQIFADTFFWNKNFPQSTRGQYFDKDILSLNSHHAEEVFIDAGCYNFSNCFEFAKWCSGKYQKIIAFEPNPNQYPVCAENARKLCNTEVKPCGLWNDNIEICFDGGGISSASGHISNNSESSCKIKAVKLDDILNGDKATFIKMDIEGAELKALKGAEQTILKHRPKLAICVYHKPEDIWEIPAYILSLRSDYRLYFRHYGLTHMETVLYAV